MYGSKETRLSTGQLKKKPRPPSTWRLNQNLNYVLSYVGPEPNLPQIFNGASNSSKIGWLRKNSLAL